MELGDAFTIEPMLTMGTAEIEIWGDNWTVRSPPALHSHRLSRTHRGRHTFECACAGGDFGRPAGLPIRAHDNLHRGRPGRCHPHADLALPARPGLQGPRRRRRRSRSCLMAAGRGGAGGGGMAFGFAPGLKLGAPCYLLHALVSCWCTSEGAIPNISTLGGQLVSDHSVREMEVTAEICLPLLQHHFLVRSQLRRRTPCRAEPFCPTAASTTSLTARRTKTRIVQIRSNGNILYFFCVNFEPCQTQPEAQQPRCGYPPH